LFLADAFVMGRRTEDWLVIRGIYFGVAPRRDAFLKPARPCVNLVGQPRCPGHKTNSAPFMALPPPPQSSLLACSVFVGGDGQTADELAKMKDQMVAVEQASNAKKCGIQFQGPPPPGT